MKGQTLGLFLLVPFFRRKTQKKVFIRVDILDCNAKLAIKLRFYRHILIFENEKSVQENCNMDELLSVFQEELLQRGSNQGLTSGLLVETDVFHANGAELLIFYDVQFQQFIAAKYVFSQLTRGKGTTKKVSLTGKLF